MNAEQRLDEYRRRDDAETFAVLEKVLPGKQPPDLRLDVLRELRETMAVLVEYRKNLWDRRSIGPDTEKGTTARMAREFDLDSTIDAMVAACHAWAVTEGAVKVKDAPLTCEEAVRKIRATLPTGTPSVILSIVSLQDREHQDGEPLEYRLDVFDSLGGEPNSYMCFGGTLERLVDNAELRAKR